MRKLFLTLLLLVLVQAVSASPNYGVFQLNTTAAGAPAQWVVNWTYTAATSNCWSKLELDNGNGTLQNVSIVTNRCQTLTQNTTFTSGSTDSFAIVTPTLNSTVGATIRWRVWANDSGTPTVFNTTPLQTFNTTAEIIFTGVDETTLNRMGINLTSQNTTLSTNWGNINNSALFRQASSNFTQGVVTVTFNNGSYSRKLFFNIGATTNISRSLYVIPNSYAYTTTLTVFVTDGAGGGVSGAVVNLQKLIGSTNTLLTQDTTPSSGAVSFIVDCLSTYILNVTGTGGSAYGSVALNCQSANNFQVTLSTGAITPLYTSAYENLTVYDVKPIIDIYDNYTIISFTIKSRYNDLRYFNLSLFYANGTAFSTQTSLNPTGGTLSVNMSKADKAPNVTIVTTHRSNTMPSDASINWTRQVYSLTNTTAPIGLDQAAITAAFPAFVYTFLAILTASTITAFVVSLAPAFQGGAGFVFVFALLPFVVWGWLSALIYGFVLFLAVSITWLSSRGLN